MLKMKDKIQKKIDVNGGKIFYCKSIGYSESHRIEYAVTNENNKVEKILKFNMWDDYSFSGYIFGDEETRTIEFEIDKQNPLYSPIIKFLGNEKQLEIQDDESRNK